MSKRARFTVPTAIVTLTLMLTTASAFACGGLVGENGSIKLTRTVKGMKVPWAGYSQGIDSSTNGPGDFKGTVEVTIYVIKEADQVKEEKALAISNTVKVKVKFE